MALSTTIDEAVTKVHRDSLVLEAIVNGPATGVTSLVTLEGGAEQKTAARAISEMLAAGYSVSVLLSVDGVPTTEGLDGQSAVDINTGIVYTKAAGAYTASSAATSLKHYIVDALPQANFGNNGDTGVLITGTLITSVIEKVSGAWVVKATLDDGLELVASDTFMTGVDVADGYTTPLPFGSLGWLATPTQGSLGFRPAPSGGGGATMGRCQISGSATTSDSIVIGFDIDNASGAGIADIDAWRTTDRFEWKFALRDSAQEYWIGFVKAPLAAQNTIGNRALGVKATATDANFMITVLGSAGEVTFDTGKVKDTTDHVLKIEWNSDAAKWKITFDGVVYELANQLSYSNEAMPGAFIKNLTAAPKLELIRFKHYEPKL